jgi:hypothetical protein
MELTAAKRPFLYFPLRRHFEQNLHVRHRLERHRAGRAMDFDAQTPESISPGTRQERRGSRRRARGAARAARLIAELL